MSDDEDEQSRLVEMVEELCEMDEGLSSWEVSFIDDMSKRSGFTEAQGEKIRQIYEKMT